MISGPCTTILVLCALLSFCTWIILACHEKGIRPLAEITRLFHQPLGEFLLLLAVVGGFVQYGVTKGTKGNDQGQVALPSRSASCITPVAIDSTGFSIPTNFPSVTNLCFWGIDKALDVVALGVAWPESLSFTNDTIDLYGNWSPATNSWSHLAAVDVSGVLSNAIVEIDVNDMPANMLSSAFFRLAPQDDTDGDGLSDAIEEWVTGTNPASGDSDGDGLGDGYEMSVGINPISTNSDGDSLCDGEEIGWWEYGGTLPVFDVSGGETLLDPYDYYYDGSFIRKLPFNICCAGYVHNTVAIYFNGVVSLLNSRHSTSEIVSTLNQDYSTCLASHYNTVIAAYWDALAAIRNSGSQITFADVVHNNQRYAVIEYSNMRLASQSKNPSCVATFQIVIPQSEPNTVYVHYISVSGDFDGSGATVGAQLPERERVFPIAFNKAGSVYGGLVIAYHFGSGSNPLCNDSDADGLGDDVEAAVGSSSRYDDSDLDGMTDYWEYMHGLHPFSNEGDYGADGDPDGDRLVNVKESEYGADPQLPDTDNDGLTDGLETGYVFITDAIPWLTFDAYVDVTTAVATNRFKRVEVAMPAPVLIQGNVVTNITMFRDGIFLMDKAGYSPAYGAPPVHGPSAVADRNALVIAPWHDSSVVFRDDIPGRHTTVRYGTATHNGEGYLLFEYLNVYADHYTSRTNAISYQLAIPTNGCDKAYTVYCNQTGQNTSGEYAYIGLQTFDALGVHTYCYHTAGKVWDGLCLEFRFGVNTDPARADTDWDGLDDSAEILLGTNPRQPDTDGDGMNDSWEFRHASAGFDPFAANDASADLDGDGLTNAQECEWDTDPNALDSDGDGVHDGAEVAQSSDPGDASDGGVAYSRVAVPFLFGDHSGSHSEKYRLDVSPVLGPGAPPRIYSWVNEQYGQCEARTAMLKPGWRYEVRLCHASTNGHGAGYPDYDYKLECFAGNVLIDDPDGLFGTDETSDYFAASDKVAKLQVLHPPKLLPDYDRDGDVDSDDDSARDTGTVFRFWVNDDNDSGDINDSANDRPGSGSNGQDDVVNGRGDLIDFTPVLIDMSGVFQTGAVSALRNRITWKLESGAVNAVWTTLSAGDAGAFQRTNCGATFGPSLSQNVHEATVTNLSGGATLPAAFLSHMESSGNKGVIMIEGRAAGADLFLRGYLDSSQQPLLEGRLNINVSSVEDMYRWMNLRAVCGDYSGQSSSLNNPTNRPDVECDGRHFVFVHGYNVNYQSARGWASEMFKRLWQSGSQSMFTAVDWFGNDSQVWEGVPLIGGQSLDYYINVRHALDTALNFSVAVNDLPGSKFVLAHSLGNMLVAEAAKYYQLDYSKYYMLNAAIPVEAFDASATADEMTEHGWRDVDSSKWAANWSEHIPYQGDPRLSLKWSSRFSGIHDVINCYSSTEDILENASMSGWGGLWGAQELFKGTATLHFIPGNCEGGWGFNGDHTNLAGLLTDFAKTNNFTDVELISSPVFRKFDNATLHQTNLISVAQTALNKVMGDGIPATSFAAGANSINPFCVLGNIAFAPRNLIDWPAARKDGSRSYWLHSDICQLSFFYVYHVFTKIKEGDSQ